ncbi:MAG: hypothetical protein O2943_10215 [Actinomycetota bacterium]|nr:hypothetical protein [Actinomycetota bacterium]
MQSGLTSLLVIVAITEMGLGLLYFLAGNELERTAISANNSQLAAIGWGASLLTGGFYGLGLLQEYSGAAIIALIVSPVPQRLNNA